MSSFAFLSSEILNPVEVEMITTSPCLKQGEHSNISELLLTLTGYKIKLYDQNFFFFFFFQYDNAKQPYLESPMIDTQLTTGLESHSPGKAQRFVKPLKSQCLILSTCTF